MGFMCSSVISSKCFKETAIYIHLTIFGPQTFPIHCGLAIRNLRTEPLLFLFSKKINLYFHIHFIGLPYFLFHTCNNVLFVCLI